MGTVIDIDPSRLKQQLTIMPRSTVWQEVGNALPPGPEPDEIRTLIAKYVPLLKQYEGFKRGQVGSSSKVPPRPKRRVATDVLCRGCGAPRSEHKDKAVLRKHLRSIQCRYFAQQGWKGLTAEQRRARTATARAAKRRKYLLAKLDLLDPRMIRVWGKEKLLERLDREFPPVPNRRRKRK